MLEYAQRRAAVLSGGPTRPLSPPSSPPFLPLDALLPAPLPRKRVKKRSMNDIDGLDEDQLFLRVSEEERAMQSLVVCIWFTKHEAQTGYVSLSWW